VLPVDLRAGHLRSGDLRPGDVCSGHVCPGDVCAGHVQADARVQDSCADVPSEDVRAEDLPSEDLPTEDVLPLLGQRGAGPPFGPLPRAFGFGEAPDEPDLLGGPAFFVAELARVPTQGFSGQWSGFSISLPVVTPKS